MARVLFTWEIGLGTGHVLPALPILQQLVAQGHEVFVALRDVRYLSAMLSAEGMKVLQAPAHPEVVLRKDGPQPQTMTQILALFGCADPAPLAALVSAWHHLLDLVRSDVLVASYAPVSLMVARSRGVRTALLALPFELPPNQHPLQPFRPGAAPPPADADDRVIQTINQVFGAYPSTPLTITRVRQVFDADLTFLMTFPELDFVNRSKGEGADAARVQYLGAMFPPRLPGAVQPRWPAVPAVAEAQSQPGQGAAWPKVFVYLHPKLHEFEAIRRELPTIPCAFFVVIADAPPEMLAQWRAANVEVSGTRVDMASALDQADAVICYAGHSTVCATALAGKPMVLVPRDLEQGLTALSAQALGLGAIANWREERPVEAALKAVLQTTRARVNCLAFAQRYAAHDALRLSTRTAESIVALAALAKINEAKRVSRGCSPLERLTLGQENLDRDGTEKPFSKRINEF